MLQQIKQLLRSPAPLRIAVHVVPKSRKNELVALDIQSPSDILLKVKINQTPEKGRVNEELIRFLAKSLELPVSHIKIVSGFTSRHKIVSLSQHALP